MNAEEVPAVTPGQAAYLAWHRKRYPGQPSELGAMRWDNYGDHARSCWEAAAEAAVAARQPQPAPGNAVTRTRLGHALAALREIAEQLDDDPPGTARNALDDDAALRNGGEQPAPELTQSAYLYHCKFGGLGGDEYGLFWRKEDADAAAANRAGEGCTQVLGMAILGTRPEQPAPGECAFRSDLVDAMLRWSGRDRADVDECASELAAILDKHPMPQPAPGSDECECTHARAEHVSDRKCYASRDDATCCPCTQYHPTTRPGAQPAPELAAAVAKSDRLEGQNEDLRALVTEILDDFWPGERFDGISEGLRDAQARVDGYRERAGLEGQ